MDNNLLAAVISAFPVIVSVALTVGALYYSYIWLPIQMQKAYRQSLLTLSRAVETKDTGCDGRGERVAGYVVAVARELKIPSKKMREMEYAAFLHDIGNVRVPHYILNNPKSLETTDLDVLKLHPVVGSKIVAEVKFLKDIAPVVRHHHELWDGSGYPDGLSKENIPFGSRILAVCTAYDSLVCPRCIDSRICKDDALLSIRAGSGTLYDPVVVDAFLKVMKEQNLD